MPLQLSRLERALSASSFEGISSAINSIESLIAAPSRELRQALRVTTFMCNRAAESVTLDEKAFFLAGAQRSIRMLKAMLDLEEAIIAAQPASWLGRKPLLVPAPINLPKGTSKRQRTS